MFGWTEVIMLECYEMSAKIRMAYRWYFSLHCDYWRFRYYT